MRVKKKLSDSEVIEKQKLFNSKLVESGAWTYENGKLVPNPNVDYETTKIAVMRIKKLLG